jgi:hypothetical protein
MVGKILSRIGNECQQAGGRYGLIILQPSQPLPGIFNLSYPRVSVLPEVEEFFVVFDGFCGAIPNSFS